MSAPTDEQIAARREIETRVWERIRRSIVTRADPDRTLPDPNAAAAYARNALLHHERQLLAEAAVTFARFEVEEALARVASGGGSGRGS